MAPFPNRIFSILLLMGFLTTLSCDTDLTDPNKLIDWEGNYPVYNEAYRDSILFTSDRYAGTNFAPSIHIMHRDGTGIRALTTEWFTFGASWSPRKWKVLFTADTSFGSSIRVLYSMEVDKTNKQLLSQSGEDVWCGRWSPDGQKIAYVVLDDTVGHSGKIKVINPDGSDPIEITDWIIDLRHFSWSADSRSIVFAGGIPDTNGNWSKKIYRTYIDGYIPILLIPYELGCYTPDCSPDGQKIAFSAYALVGAEMYTKIFTFDIRTQEMSQITSGQSFDERSNWSPDNKKIMFSSREPGGSPNSIFIIDADGTNLLQITDDSASDWGPCWH